MREIKFRAWDTEEKRYLKPIDTASMVLRFISGRVTDGATNYPYIELQQYTGLLDKNGVEIYEGDILRIYDDFNAKVFYNLRFSSFEVATTGNSVGFYSKSGLEVIGNIYENPELLS